MEIMISALTTDTQPSPARRWLDVVGDEEKMITNDEIVLAVNQTLEAYNEEAKQVWTKQENASVL